MKKIVTLLVAFPAALILVTLAIANRHPVRLVLDPFRPEAPVISMTLPFYAYLLSALIAGVALGGIATWFNQGHWRTKANLRIREVRRWQSEAERLSRERDDIVMAGRSATQPAERGKQLAVAGR